MLRKKKKREEKSIDTPIIALDTSTRKILSRAHPYYGRCIQDNRVGVDMTMVTLCLGASSCEVTGSSEQSSQSCMDATLYC